MITELVPARHGRISSRRISKFSHLLVFLGRLISFVQLYATKSLLKVETKKTILCHKFGFLKKMC